MTGRPTLYNDDIPDKVRAYVKDFEAAGDLLPSVEGLADLLDVHRETIYAWARDPKKQEFSDTLEQLKRKQKKILLDNALLGNYNATIAKLMLSCNHGMVERTAKEISGPEGAPVEVTQTKIILVDGLDDDD